MTENERIFVYEGRENSFRFEPEPRHEDIATIARDVKDLGYRLLFRSADYSLEEVQSLLRDIGPSEFLNGEYLQHDISPKAPGLTVEEFISLRLNRLAPQSELVIVDPYLFTSSPKPDADAYVASVVRLMLPLMSDGAALTVVVDPRSRNVEVEKAVRRALTREQPTLEMTVVESEDFHDRFWMADGSRGVIVGSSLNKIGSKIFFIDELSDDDVDAIMFELRQRGVGSPAI